MFICVAVETDWNLQLEESAVDIKQSLKDRVCRWNARL